MIATTTPAQSLCVQCGLCCDGTIFERGRISAEDDLARLEADGFILIATAQGTGFIQPCLHHQNGICAVYQQRRPRVCHTFRCRLLRRFEAGELAWEEAYAQIERTVALADQIRAQLPAQGEQEAESLKQRMLDWQQAQTAAGVNVHRTFARLLLDFASLQRILDLHFRIKDESDPVNEKSSVTAKQSPNKE